MASTSVATRKIVKDDESDEDKELQNELKLLVDKIVGTDVKLIPPAIEMLKYLIRTSTTSMTSVPKPLKYLAPYYNLLKDKHRKMANGPVKKSLADVISVLAMGTAGGEEAKKNRDCLKFCLQGTMKNIGDWGHEYIRQLEAEIVQQWSMEQCEKSEQLLMPLIDDIINFNCNHHAEIQACDLLMEIDRLNMLPKYIGQSTYQRMCLYFSSCAKYVGDDEGAKILELIYEQYLKFREYSRALITAIQLNRTSLVKRVFDECEDKVILFQLAFICARHLYPVDLDPNMEGYDELNNIMSNSLLSSHFLSLVRELDVMEPKTPEEVYKVWLEPVPLRVTILGEKIDSAKQNLASSFVNGFVNAGFGSDKLLSTDNGNKWIFRNKEHGMMSATASLGLLYLWDVDGGLTPIDKYLYTTEDYIKAGALLALGIVNCRVRNECDPALALLGDYVGSPNEALRVGAVLGIGLAYAGTHREDVLQILLPTINSASSPETFGVTCLACGLISLGTHREDVLQILLPTINSASSPETFGVTCLACGLISLGKNDNEVPSTVLNSMIEMNNTDKLKSPHIKLAAFGVSLCYFGTKDKASEVATSMMEVFEEPFKTAVQTMLTMCAYAGTGDVLIIQELLRVVEEKVEIPEKEKDKDKDKDNKDKEKKPKEAKDVREHKKDGRSEKGKKSADWDYSLGQAMATLAVAAVSFGEELGMEMVQRIFGHMGRYGEPSVRKAVPLAIALSSISNPQLNVMDVLTKYSHDTDDEVACNAIFGLGFIGAGTNNARLAASLRQLAMYHSKNPSQLFMVRIAQGLVHMSKGTITLNPLHTDRMLLDPVGMAGVLTVLVALMEPFSLILGRSHYLLYALTASIQPRWLLTLDERLEVIPTTVRVGQAVDVVGKAGTPKTIAGIHTHSTPVLLAAAERAELVSDEYELFAPTLDGICVLKKNPEKSG